MRPEVEAATMVGLMVVSAPEAALAAERAAQAARRPPEGGSRDSTGEARASWHLPGSRAWRPRPS